MTHLQSAVIGNRGRIAAWALTVAMIVFSPAAYAQQPDNPAATPLKPRYYLVSNATGNLLLFVDDTLSLVAGCQSPLLVRRVKALIDSLHAPPVRYALMFPGDSASVFGDGGWRAAGAVTIAHENLWVAITRRADSLRKQGLTPPLPPLVSFSEVLQLYLPNEEVHFVHRWGGITDADVIIHFETSRFVMLGTLIATSEYPAIDDRNRKALTDLVASIAWFADTLPRRKVEPVVPGRGPVLTVDDLRDYERMLMTVADRIDKLRTAGRSEGEVVAAKPTADFDARWGRGRVSPDAFVRRVFRILGQ